MREIIYQLIKRRHKFRGGDIGIICRTQQEYKSILDVFNPLKLDVSDFIDSPVIFMDGTKSSLKYSTKYYECIEYSELFKIQPEIY